MIYCDESDANGRLFSNFFGGVLVRSGDREAIEGELHRKKDELGLKNEIKWSRVTAQYLEKYIEFMSFYFEFVMTGRIKCRVMFTQNRFVPIGLSREQRGDSYFLLYYQFVKHAFGLAYCNPNNIDSVRISLLLDQLPDKAEKCKQFKEYLARLPSVTPLSDAKIILNMNEISEIDSKRHVIIQGLDIILGSMAAKLNDKFIEKVPGTNKRGKRTIAKERLYKHINKQIRQIFPNFNIGRSTSTRGNIQNRWLSPYSHWRFVPKNYEIDSTLKKGVASRKST